MNQKLRIGALIAAVIAAAAAVLFVAGVVDDDPPAPEAEQHLGAVAVAEEYLRAFAEGDVRALCATYDQPSRKDAFATYDVRDCAAYAKAHMADGRSGYAATRHMNADFQVGDATGDDQRVDVAFEGDVEYTGEDQAAIDYYRLHPKVSGSVVVVREGSAWKVDAAATQETF